MRRAHLGEGYNSQQTTSTEILEEENEGMTSQLSEKVKALKTLSIDIGTEVRDQNEFLKRMDDDFDNSGGFLRSTMNRVTSMAKAGHNCYILYMLTFSLFVFFVIWLILKTR